MIYEIKNDKIVLSASKLTDKSTGLICIFSEEEWQEYSLIENSAQEKIKFCKIEDAKKYMYGTLCVPVKNKFPANYCCYFYFYNKNLIFIEKEARLNTLIEEIINTKSKKDYTIVKFFHDLLEIIIKDDLSYLEKLEERLSSLEAKVIKNEVNNFNETIIRIKKEILRFYHYYNQLLDLTDTLIDSYITTEEIFGVYSDRVGRLQSEALLLREYTQELQNLYESQISLHQNDVMKVLTIVTTIFLPLTLITGWYGMNFKYMPELTWEFGYPMIFIVFALIIIICLIIFKKRKFW